MRKNRNQNHKRNGNFSTNSSGSFNSGTSKPFKKEVLLDRNITDSTENEETFLPIFTRHSARVTALQLLYDIAITGRSFEEVWEKAALTGDSNQIEFTRRLVLQTHLNSEKLDEEISRWVEHWTVDRLALTDKLILRMALCELFILEETPPKVVMNEAIEIAKAFSTSQSGRFINGVLDAAANARISNLSAQ